ncbi:hypothetical protein MPTK2_7g06820 [Marchantia polymorpha subsp. ruderalis]
MLCSSHIQHPFTDLTSLRLRNHLSVCSIDCQHLSDGHALVCLDRDCLIRLHNRPSWFPCTSLGLQLQNSPKVPKLVILKAVAMFTAS